MGVVSGDNVVKIVPNTRGKMAYGSEGEFTTAVGQEKGQKEAVGSSGVSRGERTLAPLSCPE